MADVESGAYEGAFVSNSHGVAAVGAIDSHRLPVDAGLLGTLARLFDDAPWDPV
jgi:hypothetical protein